MHEVSPHQQSHLYLSLVLEQTIASQPRCCSSLTLLRLGDQANGALSCRVELQVTLGLCYFRARSREIAADSDTEFEMLSPLIPSSSEAQYQLAHTSDNQSSQILVSHYISSLSDHCCPLEAAFTIFE